MLDALPDSIKERLVDYVHLDSGANVQAVLDEIDPLKRQQDEQHVQQHLGRLLSKQGGMESRAVGGGSSMGGSPKVSLSTPGGTVSSKADIDDTTNQL